MNKSELVEYHYNRACEIALALVEKKARKILRENPHIHEFVMAMGLISFSDIGGRTIEHMIEYRTTDCGYRYEPEEWAADLVDFIEYWNPYLKLTGEPMRLIAEGPVIRSW